MNILLAVLGVVAVLLGVMLYGMLSMPEMPRLETQEEALARMERQRVTDRLNEGRY